jgi:phage baseplate assembly protein W
LLSQILGAKFGSGLSQLLDDGLFKINKKVMRETYVVSVISVEQRFEIVYVFF